MIQTFNVQRQKNNGLRNIVIACVATAFIGGYAIKGCSDHKPIPPAGEIGGIVREQVYNYVRQDLEANHDSRKKELLELSDIAVKHCPSEVYRQIPQEQRIDYCTDDVKDKAKGYGRSFGDYISGMGQRIREYFE
jgi:hypothetical protein